MNDQLSNKILEQIDLNKIIPTPRWHFVLLEISFWLLAFLSLIISSVAVGVTLFLFIDYRRHGLSAMPHSVMEFLMIVPYIWASAFIIFIIIARISIKHIKKGYSYKLSTVIFASMILCIVFGSIINYVGIGKITHEFLEKIPFYNSANYDSKDAWNEPTLGRLAGVIVSIKDNNNFSIEDFSGHIWQIQFAPSASNLFIPEINSTIRISGMLESNVFIAHFIHEWEE